MVGLGRSAASISALGMINLQGPLAYYSRRAAYAARMPTPKQKALVGLSWMTDVMGDALSVITSQLAPPPSKQPKPDGRT